MSKEEKEYEWTYKGIRDNLKTGDIVLFSGAGIVSTGIKIATRSKWSHVGMVYYSQELDCNYVWESTRISNMEDARSEKEKMGVQLSPLSERIKQYKGKVAIRHLNNFFINPDHLATLACFRNEVKGRPYERKMIELAYSALDSNLFRENVEDLSSIFCSELVAETYQRLGLLSECVPSNEYTPKDFGWGRMVDRSLLAGNLGYVNYIKS